MKFTVKLIEKYDDLTGCFNWFWAVYTDETNYQRSGRQATKRMAKRKARRAAKSIKRQYEHRRCYEAC